MLFPSNLGHPEFVRVVDCVGPAPNSHVVASSNGFRTIRYIFVPQYLVRISFSDEKLSDTVTLTNFFGGCYTYILN